MRSHAAPLAWFTPPALSILSSLSVLSYSTHSAALVLSC